MKRYSWQETLEVERQGEIILDAVFALDYIIVKATRAHQRQKIDRVIIHRQDALQMFRVDYKIDFKAGETGNLALEDVSVRRNGRIQARGWVHETIAHLVAFYVPPHSAYVLETASVRERWADIQTGFKLLTTSTERDNHVYQTEFYAVPIVWLRSNGLIQKEQTAVGAQMRLDLKYQGRR